MSDNSKLCVSDYECCECDYTFCVPHLPGEQHAILSVFGSIDCPECSAYMKDALFQSVRIQGATGGSTNKGGCGEEIHTMRGDVHCGRPLDDGDIYFCVSCSAGRLSLDAA